MVAALLPWCATGGQADPPLSDAASRESPDYPPKHKGRTVRARAKEAVRAVQVINYARLPIHDDAGPGLTLEGELARLAAFEPGDRIEATGPIPVPAGALIAVLALLVLPLGAWYLRERRMPSQRRVVRGLYALSEKMTVAQLPADNLKCLRSVLPELLGVTGVELYLADRSAGTLRRLAAPDAPARGTGGFRGRAIESCYRNRSLLAAPDVYRSPFYQGDDELLPQSVLFVPMFAQSDLMGVLEIDDAKRVRRFSEEERALAQHLANQIAIGLKLVQQRDIREQLFRSEKLAATGQLVSSVASELRAPIEAIANLAETVLVSRSSSAVSELRSISSKARRALEIVGRLLTLARAEKEGAKPVDVGAVLRYLLRVRERIWNERGIQLEEHLPLEPVTVSGSQGHLEQVFFNLLTIAEKQSAKAREKKIIVRATRLAENVELEIGFCGDAAIENAAGAFGGESDEETGTLGLALCRSILRSHGGELRLTPDLPGCWRFEVELPALRTPATARASTGPAMAGRPITALVVDPDPEDQRKLTALLGDAGHRAVAAGSAEEAAGFVGRLHFQAVFCSVHLPGLNWIEFFDSIRGRVDAFVLLTEGYDDELLRAVSDREGFILTKPVETGELSQVLASVETRMPAAAG